MSNEATVPLRYDTSPEWLRQWVRVLVFIFPIAVATVGWGSVIFGLLLLPALYYGRGWKSLTTWERRIMLGYLLVFVAMALSMINADDLKEGVQMLDRFLRFVMIVPIYLMFRRYRFSMGRELAAGAFVACLVMAGQAVYEVVWQGAGHAQGHYHKIVFGDLAVWWAAVVAVMAVTVAKNWWLRAAAIAAILLALYASVLSQTRGAWLFIPLIPLVLLWSQWGELKNLRIWAVAGFVILMIAGGGALFQSEKIINGVQRGLNDLERFADDPGTGNSWGTRLNLWRNSLLLAQEHPILGSGVGDFRLDMERLVEDGRSWSPYVVRYSHAHSIYFDALARAGIVGLFATVLAILLLPLVFFARGVRRATEPWSRFYAIGGVMLVAAFATFGLSEGLWARNPFVNTYVITLVVFMAGLVDRRQLLAGSATRSSD